MSGLNNISHEMDTFYISKKEGDKKGYTLSYYREKDGVVVGNPAKSIPIDVTSEQGLELLDMIYKKLTYIVRDGEKKEAGFREVQNGDPKKANSSFELISSDGSARVVLDNEKELDMLMTARNKIDTMSAAPSEIESPKSR